MNIGAVGKAATSNLNRFEKAIKWGAETKFVQTLVTKHKADKNFYPNFVLGLIILQNLIGTLTYTIASWNNTGMPKEQRKFAAAIDLMNGIFNFGVILTIGQLINNNSDKWAESLAKGFKNLNDKAGYESAKLGFRSFLTIVIAGVFVQRVIVPFLATPCAKWFKEKYLNKDKNIKINPERQTSFAQKLNDKKVRTVDPNDPFKCFNSFQNSLNKMA